MSTSSSSNIATSLYNNLILNLIFLGDSSDDYDTWRILGIAGSAASERNLCAFRPSPRIPPRGTHNTKSANRAELGGLRVESIVGTARPCGGCSKSVGMSAERKEFVRHGVGRRALSARNVALYRRPMHVTAQLRRTTVREMDRAAIVPEHDVVLLPAMTIGKASFRAMYKEALQ